MYHVSAQGVDERMINVHYYYLKQAPKYAMFGSFVRHDAEPIWAFSECTIIITIKVFTLTHTVQNLVGEPILSTHMHTPTHISILTIDNSIYRQQTGT